MKIAITVDVENDPIGNLYLGVKKGLPQILKVFEKNEITATFFITGDILDKFPDLIKKISKKNEIAIHGTYQHIRLNKFEPNKLKEIIEIKKKIEKLTDKPVYGFRAPFLDIDLRYPIILKNFGFKYDSSIGTYRIKTFFKRKYLENNYELIVLFPNIFFRFPLGYYLFRILYYLNKNHLTIFYLHPWEAIDVRSLYFYFNKMKKLNHFLKVYNTFRIDRWVNTGNKFVKKLDNFIIKLKKSNYTLGSIKDLLKLDK